MGELLPAQRVDEVDGVVAERSAGNAGSTDTCAPVSTRKVLFSVLLFLFFFAHTHFFSFFLFFLALFTLAYTALYDPCPLQLTMTTFYFALV